jgi:hypothetical protein
MFNTTKVIGTVRNAMGIPYEGALIRVYLSTPITASNSIVGTELFNTFSNSYGKFEINLVPNSADTLGNSSYYVIEIIKENTQVYRKIVSASATPVRLEELPDYVPPGQRPVYIGRDSSAGSSSGSSVRVDLTGIFKWTNFDGDGSTKTFSAPGEIYIVVLNGLLLMEGIDYTKSVIDTIVFNTAPNNGEIIGLQYKI